MKLPAAGLGLVLTFGAAAALAAPSARALASVSPQEGQGRDPLFRMIGGFREALGDAAFSKADVYMHGGADFLVLKKFSGAHGEEAEHVDSADPDDHAHHHDHDDHDEHDDSEHQDDSHYHEAADPALTATPPSWVWKVYQKVKAAEDRHTDSENSRELLPFLQTAIQLNPHHVPAILNTAYWVDTNFNKTDTAVAILEQGLKDNPGDWELAESLGRLYFDRKKDYVRAAHWFEQGVEFARRSPDKVLDSKVRGMFLYLGKSYLALGHHDRAVQAMTLALELAKASGSAPAIAQMSAELAKIQNSRDPVPPTN